VTDVSLLVTLMLHAAPSVSSTGGTIVSFGSLSTSEHKGCAFAASNATCASATAASTSA